MKALATILIAIVLTACATPPPPAQGDRVMAPTAYYEHCLRDPSSVFCPPPLVTQ